MVLTLAQKQALKADIVANFPGVGNSPDDHVILAAAYNQIASPDFWVWRTNVSRSDIYTKQNDLAVSGAQTGFWNWTTFKNQGVSEQTAWVQMFMGDQANFSAQNIREGIAAIFTGSAAATAQRDHCLAIGRRKSTRGEKLFATGAGSAAAPATMGPEGAVTAANIDEARNS